jgi:ribosome-associated protein
MDDESIRSEIAYRFSRSSGPGGQHANKSSTRAEAIFDVEGSQALTPAEKRRVLERAGPVLRAVAQDERSQLRNRELAADRIVEQLRAANYRPRVRTPTKPTKGAREQRLESKHRRAGTKRLRSRPTDDA